MPQRWIPILISLIGCSPSSGTIFDGINLFTIADDITLGQQLRDEIAASPADFPILDEAEYPEAYEHIYQIRDEILATGEVIYADEFAWETYIIDDPDTLNAFAAPGGYIYVYTGLIEFLEYEDELAGVMGHEIAHADQRHSTQQLTKAYGLSSLIGLVLGEEPGLLAELAAGLANLNFSRADESESDDYSVEYLCETPWAADGAAGFFEKLESGGVPEFLSTHPSSDTRVEDISAYAVALGCSTERSKSADYQSILDSLP
ncbi:MAG: M48 family metalloprotease [Myxococcota bacterium]|nr:M48 family metalloprotease [Myxococcota bacterium]